MIEWIQRVKQLRRFEKPRGEIIHVLSILNPRRIHVEISTSNRCHIFHVDSPFEIDEISTNFPRGILTSNRWRIDEDVSIWMIKHFRNDCVGSLFSIIESNGYVNDTVCPIALEKGLEREEHWMKTLRTK